MSNFLDVDENILARKLILGNGINSDYAEENQPNFEPQILTPSERQERSQCKFIIPQPGFCVKTKDVNTNEKVFLNFGKSDDVLEPNIPYPDYQLAEILDSGTDDEIATISIPMSIAQDTHTEKDKSGKASLVIDIIINSTFMENKIKLSEIYKCFLITVAIEGVEAKHKMTLDKNGYVILANRKNLGKLQPQFVRHKPSIQEVKTAIGSTENELKRSSSPAESSSTSSKVKRLVEELRTDENELECHILQISENLAKAEIKIPNLRKPEELKVNLGADRIVIESPVGFLDIFVDLDIHQENCKAKYNCETNILLLELSLFVKP